jgi:hypothetical protein
MEVASAFEVNDPAYPLHILIATQGSDFKDSVVSGVISDLRSKPLYIKVIDVSELSSIKEQEWTSMIILHTWEYSKPQQDAKDFIERIKDKKKLVVLTTSGEGSFKINDIDGITSASRPADITNNSKEITRRVNALLKTEEK